MSSVFASSSASSPCILVSQPRTTRLPGRSSLARLRRASLAPCLCLHHLLNWLMAAALICRVSAKATRYRALLPTFQPRIAPAQRDSLQRVAELKKRLLHRGLHGELHALGRSITVCRSAWPPLPASITGKRTTLGRAMTSPTPTDAWMTCASQSITTRKSSRMFAIDEAKMYDPVQA